MARRRTVKSNTLAARATTTTSNAEPHVGAPIDANGNLTGDGNRTFAWDARISSWR
jgi:hypothetical protein